MLGGHTRELVLIIRREMQNSLLARSADGKKEDRGRHLSVMYHMGLLTGGKVVMDEGNGTFSLPMQRCVAVVVGQPPIRTKPPAFPLDTLRLLGKRIWADYHNGIGFQVLAGDGVVRHYRSAADLLLFGCSPTEWYKTLTAAIEDLAEWPM
ncbi:MAG: hypothetical protein WAN50_04950 [Minisyncoccia bacterium]